MEDLKKHSIVLDIVFLLPLSLGLTAVASAQNQGFCSASSIAGQWGYSETGTITLPTGISVPYASLGRYSLDSQGNLTGKRTASAGGTLLSSIVEGTVTVNADCTGTESLTFYDASGNFAGSATKNVVYVDRATEAVKILTSATFADGTNIPGVLITKAKKMFPGGDNAH